MSNPMHRPTQMSATQAAHYQQMQQIYLQQAMMHQQNQALQTASYFGTAAALNTWTGYQGTNAVTQTATTTTSVPTWVSVVPSGQLCADNQQRLFRDIVITDGVEHNIFLPDGTAILIARDGSFTINDKDAKITYRANRVRDFNSFVNASDKLEDFIRFCGMLGVRQDEMLKIPIQHFIAWLIVEAAHADGEANVDVKPLEKLLTDHVRRTRTRCRCGRFLGRKHIERKITFCRPVCLERELAAPQMHSA